jgi:hypothetical protein
MEIRGWEKRGEEKKGNERKVNERREEKRSKSDYVKLVTYTTLTLFPTRIVTKSTIF